MTIDLLSEHIASEELASRTYRFFKSWCGLNGWPGCEAYFLAESKDELEHMFAFQDYVDDRYPLLAPPPIGGQPEIVLPPTSLLQCFTSALALERKVLEQINAIGRSAIDEADYDTIRFIQPFTKIGIESIRELTTFTQQLQIAGDSASALLQFDDEISG